MDRIGDFFGDTGAGAPPASAPSRRSRPAGAVFFAARPDAAAGAKAAAVAEELRATHRLQGKPQARDVLHVTLFAIGNLPELPQERIDAARKVAATFRMAPFEIAFDRALSFDTKKPKLPLVLAGGDGVAKFRLLRQALLGDMRRVGIRPTAGSDEPHMTLLYDPRQVPAQPIERISWPVHEFVLVHSLYGLGRHEELGRWGLRG